MRRAAARALLLAAAAALPGSRLLLAPYGSGSGAISGIAAALENGLARTPPLGWSSWNRFGCDIDEALIRETADAMVARGLRDAGCDRAQTSFRRAMHFFPCCALSHCAASVSRAAAGNAATCT
jgi:hypothetical protein